MMGNSRLRAQMEHEREVEDVDFDMVVDSVVDEALEIELTHNSTIQLGGQAQIKLGPIKATFTSIVSKDDEVLLKGAIGKTIMRVDKETDVANTIEKFAERYQTDINYIRREYDNPE